MKQANPARTIPDRPIYFSVEVPDRGVHHFRVPRPSVVGRLLRPMIESGIWTDSDEIDPLAAELTEEAVGAALGTCWAHASLDLETRRRDYPRGPDGLLDYGAEVLSELHEAGYTTEQLEPMISEVGSKLIVANLPRPQEVDEQVNFTATKTASETSSPLTSG